MICTQRTHLAVSFVFDGDSRSLHAARILESRNTMPGAKLNASLPLLHSRMRGAPRRHVEETAMILCGGFVRCFSGSQREVRCFSGPQRGDGRGGQGAPASFTIWSFTNTSSTGYDICMKK